MTTKEVLKELQALGNEGTRKILKRHGARDPIFGVKIGDMQKIRKRIKVDYQLALDLWDTGNYDAMYFAGLIADDGKMTKAQLRKWAKEAYGASLAGSIVPWVATGNPHGPALALEWMDRKNDAIAAIGWNTFASLVMVKEDAELDLPKLKKLLKRVEKEIHQAGDETKYAMNNFVIATGCGVAPLFDLALKTAQKIGRVEIDHGETSCQTPFGPDYIRKVEQMGRIGRKRKRRSVDTMNDLQRLRETMLALPETTEETPFGPEVLVYKVAGKMFATLTPEDVPVRMNLKCDPDRALELRDDYDAILPGYHMNKQHWNTLELDGSLTDGFVEELIRHSFDRVLSGHTKANRERIEAQL